MAPKTDPKKTQKPDSKHTNMRVENINSAAEAAAGTARAPALGLPAAYVPVISHALPLQPQGLPQNLDRQMLFLSKMQDTTSISVEWVKHFVMKLQVAYQTELRLQREQHEQKVLQEKLLAQQNKILQANRQVSDNNQRQLDNQKVLLGIFSDIGNGRSVFRPPVPTVLPQAQLHLPYQPYPNIKPRRYSAPNVMQPNPTPAIKIEPSTPLTAKPNASPPAAGPSLVFTG